MSTLLLGAGKKSDLAAATQLTSHGSRPPPRTFFNEAECYELLSRAGISPPRAGFVGGALPFAAGERVVLKGLASELWHKSELGAVQFLEFDVPRIERESAAMRQRIEDAGYAWQAGLVCERIAKRPAVDLPQEAFVSLSRSEAGWTILFGFGGLQAEALAELAPPCRWPVAVMTPESALAELEQHLVGRIWLGRVRSGASLTSGAELLRLVEGLWRLAGIAEAHGLDLIELNPVALDGKGRPRPLDAVGRGAAPAQPRRLPPARVLEALRRPRRIALAGVSSAPAGVGRTILDNLARYRLPSRNLILIKPLDPRGGGGDFLGYPCVADVSGLRSDPVDLLILALPAPAAVEVLTALVQQGGGASCVALVAGGIGDGADVAGLGERVRSLLHERRAEGRWTPAVLGPNFLGHWSPDAGLDTSFIPVEKLSPPVATGGELTLLSQSGAFLLCRRSRQPELRFGLGVALGNQIDVSIADLLAELAEEETPGPVACYVEGFGPGQLEVFAQAASRLHRRGASVVLYRAGRTTAGQAAAASHTGAMAGDLELEASLLTRCGVRFAASIAEFDAALAWLAAYPRLRSGNVGLVTNAGFESVNGSDLSGKGCQLATLDESAQRRLGDVLRAHRLGELVAPRLPVDLTPMADESAYLAVAEVVLNHCDVLVVGLVPFTRNLHTEPAPAREFAQKLSALARSRDKPLAIVIDAGAGYSACRQAFVDEGVLVFDRIETALRRA